MKKEKIRPVGDKILVKPDEEQEKTSGGLFIPEGFREKALHGTVVAIGQGKRHNNGKLKPMTVKVDDKVYYTKNYTTDVLHNDSKHLLMSEDRILGIEY